MRHAHLRLAPLLAALLLAAGCSVMVDPDGIKPDGSDTGGGGTSYTATLYAVPALDGMVWSSTYVYTDLPYLYAGDNSQDYYGRAFVSFDLGALPAGTTAVTGATLELYQEGITGAPYDLGALGAEYVQYGASLDAADLDLSALGSFSLSSTAAIEWKTADVGTAVANAWANRVALSNRAQFRLRFATDGDADATADYAILTSGDSTTNRPRLVVTYQAP